MGPGGIRNGGLPLVLVVLAAVVALVDDPPRPSPSGVRVRPVSVGVRPPALLGRDLPEVRVATPEVAVETPAGLTAVR